MSRSTDPLVPLDAKVLQARTALASVGAALADARKRHALSYRAAGAAIGIDAPTMVRIEKGVLLPTEAQWKALRQFIGSAP